MKEEVQKRCTTEREGNSGELFNCEKGRKGRAERMCGEKVKKRMRLLYGEREREELTEDSMKHSRMANVTVR